MLASLTCFINKWTIHTICMQVYILFCIWHILMFQVYDSDDLPTKICFNCEEKMVTFELFLRECYKVQEILQKTLRENHELLLIQTEFSKNVEEVPIVKSEVSFSCLFYYLLFF